MCRDLCLVVVELALHFKVLICACSKFQLHHYRDTSSQDKPRYANSYHHVITKSAAYVSGAAVQDAQEKRSFDDYSDKMPQAQPELKKVCLPPSCRGDFCCPLFMATAQSLTEFLDAQGSKQYLGGFETRLC